MSVIDKIGKRLESTAFDLKIDKISYYNNKMLSFVTAKNKYGLFLSVDIDDREDTIVVNMKLRCDKRWVKLPNPVYYFNDNLDNIIKDISRLISKVYDLDDTLLADFSNLTTQNITSYDISWEDVFKMGLLDIFGKRYSGKWDEDIFVEFIGVNFVVTFDDDYNFLTVKVMQNFSPFNEKMLLRGTVSANNYTNVLEKVKSIYEYVSKNYSDLEKIADNIMWN